MNGKLPFTERIKPAEALELFDYARIQEMYIVKELYEAYRESHNTDTMQILAILDGKHFFDFCSFLSFLYDTGRVQGIREERSRRT